MCKEKTFEELVMGRIVRRKRDDCNEYGYDKDGNVIYTKTVNGFECWRDYNSNGKLIYSKNTDNDESWYDYDESDNLIHYKNSTGFEYWSEYDENNNCIHHKDTNDYEYWKEYKCDKCIHYKSSSGIEYWYNLNGDEITKEEYDKLYNNEVEYNICKDKTCKIISKDGSLYEYYKNCNLIHYKCSYGFEEWKEYDQNNNMIHYRNIYGYEYWKDYDSDGNCIHCKDCNKYEYWIEYNSNGNMIHYRDSDNDESWYEYDKNGNLIHYKDNHNIEKWYGANKCEITKEEFDKMHNKKEITMYFENINEEKSFEELVMGRIVNREVNGNSEFGYDSNDNCIHYKNPDLF